jgi:hypothetical protein
MQWMNQFSSDSFGFDLCSVNLEVLGPIGGSYFRRSHIVALGGVCGERHLVGFHHDIQSSNLDNGLHLVLSITE